MKRRRSFFLTEPQRIYLEAEAARLGITISDLIRRIVDRYREDKAPMSPTMEPPYSILQMPFYTHSAAAQQSFKDSGSIFFYDYSTATFRNGKWECGESGGESLYYCNIWNEEGHQK